MWFRRKRRWPKVDLYSPGGSGAIKALRLRDLEHLMAKAASDVRCNALGRPEWVTERETQIRQIAVTAFGQQAPGLLRSLVTVILHDDSGGRFTLDIPAIEFAALQDLAEADIVRFAHLYLAGFPVVDLDSARGDDTTGWEYWKRWAEGGKA